MKQPVVPEEGKGMKEDEYTAIICKGFCRFYREGKEEMQCGTYVFLRDRFPSRALSAIVEGAPPEPDLSMDAFVLEEVCGRCEFRTDGCDFREGLDSPPCGGYVIVEYLAKRGIITGPAGE